MPAELTLAFQISLVGMSLVFGSILLLWGVMALMVRLTAARKPREVITAGVPDLERRRKRQAAAAAVAVALARQNEDGISEFPLPPTAIVSAWQAVLRANNMMKRGPVR